MGDAGGVSVPERLRSWSCWLPGAGSGSLTWCSAAFSRFHCLRAACVRCKGAQQSGHDCQSCYRV